jgi:polyisoprenoid-binding protein YceI
MTGRDARGPLALATMLALSAIGSQAAAEPARYELDPEHLTMFDEATGTLSEVRVVVETDSVATHHEARDEHLQSRDFLNTAAKPTMTFTALGARRTGERTFAVSGELDLNGTRRPLVLDATWNKTAPYPIGARAEVMGVSLRGTLQRSEFGMTYGVADDLVGDEVEIMIELEARRVPGNEPRR